MGGLSRKYVVFKAEDWDIFISELPGKYRDDAVVALPAPITDAVVLRKQDVFTSSALYEYAGQIRTAIEVCEKMRSQPDQESFIDELRQLADAFMDEGEQAETLYKRKLPD